MEHRQRRPCHAGTLPAGTVAPGSVPAPAARHRNGEQTPPPTICTGTHPAQQIAPPVQTEGQSSSAPRAAALAFFFCPSSSPAACPACRISSPARAGCCAAATMTTPAHRRRSRSHRLPPAPGRISTASAAPDDHASSRPPHLMTTHQRQPCPPAQRSQTASLARPHSASASRQRRHRGRTNHASAAHLPPPALLPPAG